MPSQEQVAALSAEEQQLVLMALQAFGWRCTQESGDVLLSPPDSEEGESGDGTLRYGLERLEMSSPAVAWLVERLQAQPLVNARPSEQPAGVRELSQRLFEAYQCKEGNVRLGGCLLEMRPLLRVSHWRPQESTDRRLRHWWISEDGGAISGDLVSELGLDAIIAEAPPSTLSSDQVGALRSTAREACGCRAAESGEGEICFTTLVWCTHAEGKLEFEINETRESVGFSDWAKLLAKRPPPFVCPHTGAASFEVGATDDGRITTVSAIRTCEVSGRRVLEADLAECAASSQWACRDLLAACPVTGALVLRSEFVECTMCQQSVGSHSMRDGRCDACRTLPRASKDDPRMARILGEHPQLDRWRRWRLAETDSVYIARAGSFFRRYLFVMDKESLKMIRVAIGSRFSSDWSEAPPADVRELE